jgi:Xaa-Pro aminopeptidase
LPQRVVTVAAMTDVIRSEDVRAERLLDAQVKAEQLFAEIEARGLIRAGVGEREASDAVRDLAGEMFGVKGFWHKRIVRAGANTLLPYRENPPDGVITDDDIAFADFGPLFEEWEADFGRTFVIGADPVKLRLRDDLPRLFAAGRAYFEAHPDVTGAQLYDYVARISRDAGWEYGNAHCGHLVGEFPHEKIAGDMISNYIAPGSDEPMRRRDRSGRRCHWILEIHLVDRDRQIGGFYEQLLDLGHTAAT